MTVLLYTVHVLTCLFLILVVLLQQGKGADLSVFGGGGTMTAFGARGAASLLHKLTVGGFVLFIVTTLTIGVFESREAASVMSDIEEAAATEAAAEPEEPATPAAALPEAEDPELTAAEYDEAAAEAEAAEGEAAPAEDGEEAPAEGGEDAPAEEGGGEGQ